MKRYQRLLFGITLVTLLFGLAGHFVSVTSVCCCINVSCSEVQESLTEQSNAGVCLICQLQTGIYFRAMPLTIEPGKMRFTHIDTLSPIKFVSQILRPPILL
jgi:hypothetical protein